MPSAHHLEVVGEGLAHAVRVVDDDRDTPARHQGEGHGHAVVIVRVNGHVVLDLGGEYVLKGCGLRVRVRAVA